MLHSLDYDVNIDLTFQDASIIAVNRWVPLGMANVSQETNVRLRPEIFYFSFYRPCRPYFLKIEKKKKIFIFYCPPPLRKKKAEGHSFRLSVRPSAPLKYYVPCVCNFSYSLVRFFQNFTDVLSWSEDMHVVWILS